MSTENQCIKRICMQTLIKWLWHLGFMWIKVYKMFYVVIFYSGAFFPLVCVPLNPSKSKEKHICWITMKLGSFIIFNIFVWGGTNVIEIVYIR